MKIPYNWLKQHINTNDSPADIADKLTLAGHALDRPIFEEAGDKVMDFEDRGNRADITGILGIARDYSAISGTPLIYPKLSEVPRTDNHNFKPEIKVHSNRVKRWRAVVFKDVKVGKSSELVSKRLASYGIEPINNIVDLTNYVMVELGMPLHAFDLDKVDQINLRMAKKGETLVTFEGIELKFDENDLVAADSKKPLTLTTAVGGRESGISDSTKNILIEAGLYDQPTARRSALRLNVRNETSARLGKYLHPEFCQVAIARLIHLAKEELKLEPENVSFDFYPDPYPVVKAELTQNRLNLVSGMDISLKFAREALEKLEFKILGSDKNSLTVEVPYFRTDVTMEDDLIEEVLRMKGYHSIPLILPQSAPPERLTFPLMDTENTTKDVLVDLGFIEVVGLGIGDINNLKSLGACDDSGKLDGPGSVVKLENSLNSNLNAMRVEMFSSISPYFLNYLKHGAKDIRLFETGKTYVVDDSQRGFNSYKEGRKVGIAVNSSFFDLKGYVEALLSEFGIFDLELREEPFVYFKSSTSVGLYHNDQRMGILGSIKKRIRDDLLLGSPTFFCELDTELILKFSKTGERKIGKVATIIPNLVSEDVTFTLSSTSKAGDILKKLKDLIGSEAKTSYISSYQDQTLEENSKKNLTFNIKFKDEHKIQIKNAIEKAYNSLT